MATTRYAVGDALAAKRFAKILAAEALVATEIWPLVGESENSVIHLKTEPKKEGGDKVTFGLMTQLTGVGVTENETQEGQEESLSTYSDDLLLTELSHAVKVKGKNTIDNQRVLFDARKKGKMLLKDWYAKRMSIAAFLHLCGYTGAAYTHRGMSIDRTKAQFNLGNTVTAPSTSRKIFAAAGGGESNTADENLESDDTFDIRLLDYAKELAMTSSVPIRPVNIEGGEFYVCYVHPYQAVDIRTSTDTGQWLDLNKNAYTGKGKDNPIFKGALGIYNGVILRESEDVTPGVNSSSSASISTVRRAVFLGAQAAAMGFGSDFNEGDGAYKWREEEFDYGRELGVNVQSLLGMTKCVFNSLDFGSITISTYAAAHT
jgi:N4-gp56 family major capsid protein